MRTTVDIDTPILNELKRIQKQEHKSLGRLMSELLAQALSRRKSSPDSRQPFRWVSRALHARVEIRDKEALYDALDRDRAPANEP